MKQRPLFFSSLVVLGLVVASPSREVRRAARYAGLRASLAVPSLVRLGPLAGVVACEPNERSSDHPAEDLRFSVNVGTSRATGETAVSVWASLPEGGVVDVDGNDELFLEDDLGAKIPASEPMSIARLDAEQHPRVSFYREDRLIRSMPLPLVRVIATRAPDRAAYDMRLVGAGVSDLVLHDPEGLPLRATFVVQVDDANMAYDVQSMDEIAPFASGAITRVPMVKDCETCVARAWVVLVGSALTSSVGSWVTYSFNPSLVFEASDPAKPDSDASVDAGDSTESDATSEVDGGADSG